MKKHKRKRWEGMKSGLSMKDPSMYRVEPVLGVEHQELLVLPGIRPHACHSRQMGEKPSGPPPVAIPDMPMRHEEVPGIFLETTQIVLLIAPTEDCLRMQSAVFRQSFLSSRPAMKWRRP